MMVLHAKTYYNLDVSYAITGWNNYIKHLINMQTTNTKTTINTHFTNLDRPLKPLNVWCNAFKITKFIFVLVIRYCRFKNFE